jgi:hypothetical protein
MFGCCPRKARFHEQHPDIELQFNMNLRPDRHRARQGRHRHSQNTMLEAQPRPMSWFDVK